MKACGAVPNSYGGYKRIGGITYIHIMYPMYMYRKDNNMQHDKLSVSQQQEEERNDKAPRKQRQRHEKGNVMNLRVTTSMFI